MPTRSLDALEAQVGETNETVRGFTIEAGKVAEFARAIHDPADCYLDERAARSAGYDAIPAPPTFPRVSYFPHYRPSGVDEEFGFDLGFDPEYVLHGEQRYRYERPLTVGDTLRGETTLENVFQRSGGTGGTMTFAVFRTDYFDAEDSRVLQAWNTRIETDGPPADSEESAPNGTIDPADTEDTDAGLEVGARGPAFETPVLDRRDFVQYAGASGDFNPIHYDEPYATDAGHPSVFGQGMFTAGVASGFLRRWAGIRGLSSFRTRFTDRVFPGEALVVGGVVGDETVTAAERTVDIEFEVVTASTDRRVLEGDATVTVED